MAKIVDNLVRVQEKMAKQDAVSAQLGLVLKNAAIAGIRGGVGSTDWKTYMSMFADSEEQLTLLTTANTPADKPWLPEVQAYLMTNSVCAPHTDTQTGNAILGTANEPLVDAGLSSVPAASVKDLRPADFKKIFP